MEIINQRINVKAVKAYQTVEMEMTVSNATEEEVAQVKAYLLNEAKMAVESLARDIEDKPKTVTQYQPKTTVQNHGFGGQRTVYQNNPTVRPISEGQVKYIRGLGYNGALPNTFTEADNLLQQLKAERGIQ